MTEKLNENWSLAIVDDNIYEPIKYKSYKEIKNIAKHVIPAIVPSNFEIDMQRAGIIDNLFFGKNLLIAQDYEYVHLFYYQEFHHKKSYDDELLVFEGIDTFSDIYLNDILIASTNNMLIPHEINAHELIDGNNRLLVHIKPTVLEARKYEHPAYSYALKYNFDAMYIRKSNYMFGWDIFPRIVSGGIFKEVYIKSVQKERFLQTYLYTVSIENDHKYAKLHLFYEIEIGRNQYKKYKIRINGNCNDSSFNVEQDVWGKAGRIEIIVENPKLWWSRGQGNADLYDIRVELIKEDYIIDSSKYKTGIRIVKLLSTNTTDENGNGEFCFILNHRKIFILGTNWVPLDSFPSQANKKITKAIDHVVDIGCNTIRCWGGGYYEDDLFYELCDKKGILIWQDFMMGCGLYPQDSEFISRFEKELVYVVRHLRQHPSICLWAGDNECDCVYNWEDRQDDPNTNVLTRKLIPYVLKMNDFTRSYLPSSPYISNECFLEGRKYIPEDHLWGPRDYFKSKFYQNSLAHFASEIGYHGCPSVESIEKFISIDNLWPYNNNDEWILHASSPTTDKDAPCAYRINLMANQIKVLFGYIPDNLERFSLLSQYSQAEAKKFFIERFRIGKWRRTGIIWWNLLDGCPQFSDAVIDYYQDKKKAYQYIKNSQAPICLMFSEPKSNSISLFGANDIAVNKTIKYSVTELVFNEVVIHSQTQLSSNSTNKLDTLCIKDDKEYFYLIKWSYDNKTFFNHYAIINGSIDSDSYIRNVNKMNSIIENYEMG